LSFLPGACAAHRSRGAPAAQAPVPRLNRAIVEEQLGVEAAARGDVAAADRLYSAAVAVRRWQGRAARRAAVRRAGLSSGALAARLGVLLR
jgi:hypothetical protein